MEIVWVTSYGTNRLEPMALAPRITFALASTSSTVNYSSNIASTSSTNVPHDAADPVDDHPQPTVEATKTSLEACLSSFSDWNVKVAHYLIHNVNNYYRLKVFLFVIQNWCHDRNLIKLLEEISFEMELVQANKLQQKVEEDIMEKMCLIY